VPDRIGYQTGNGAVGCRPGRGDGACNTSAHLIGDNLAARKGPKGDPVGAHPLCTGQDGCGTCSTTSVPGGGGMHSAMTRALPLPYRLLPHGHAQEVWPDDDAKYGLPPDKLGKGDSEQPAYEPDAT